MPLSVWIMKASEEDEVLATALLSVGCGLKMKNRKKYKNTWN